MEHGVGCSAAAPSMGGPTILKSDPRLYFLDVNGQRLELSTEQLQMPLQFQRACMEQIDFMPDHEASGLATACKQSDVYCYGD